MRALSGDLMVFQSHASTIKDMIAPHRNLKNWFHKLQTSRDGEMLSSLLKSSREAVNLPALDTSCQGEERSHVELHKTPFGAALSFGANEELDDRIRILKKLFLIQDKNFMESLVDGMGEWELHDFAKPYFGIASTIFWKLDESDRYLWWAKVTGYSVDYVVHCHRFSSAGAEEPASGEAQEPATGAAEEPTTEAEAPTSEAAEEPSTEMHSPAAVGQPHNAATLAPQQAHIPLALAQLCTSTYVLHAAVEVLIGFEAQHKIPGIYGIRQRLHTLFLEAQSLVDSGSLSVLKSEVQLAPASPTPALPLLLCLI